VRGILISVFPLVMYRALGDAALVSFLCFLIGIISLIAGLMVPFFIRFIPRRWAYTAGCIMFVGAPLILRWVQGRSLRTTVQVGFAAGGVALFRA